MKDPKVNRLIGYVVLFIGFGFFYKGFHTTTDASSIDLFGVVIGLIFVVTSIIWMVSKVRCPHCGGILDPRLTNIDYCPNCGKSTKV